MFKFFGIVVAMGLSTLFFGMAGCTAWVATGGVATVSVDTPEANIYLPVPTRLVDLGLDAAFIGAADERLALQAEMQRELGDLDIEVGEFVREVLDEVSDMPNGALVEVHGPDGEDVWIGKSRGRFLVKVDAPDARVRVSIPARSAKRIGNRALTVAGL